MHTSRGVNITWNGVPTFTQFQTTDSFIKAHHSDADIIVYNGCAIEDSMPLISGDNLVTLVKKGLPSKALLREMMVCRHSPGVHNALCNATVGIAGLGGLGSHVAIALARMGIGKLIIADFDVVEPTNLNRQAYLVSHLGCFKADALKRQLSEIHPYTDVDAHVVRLTTENTMGLFETCDVVVEAFDRADQKAMLVNLILSEGNMPIVAASGMAGLYSGNLIKSKQRTSRLFVVGDERHEATPGKGLMAPRVLIAAGHQALVVSQLITGQLDFDHNNDMR